MKSRGGNSAHTLIFEEEGFTARCLLTVINTCALKAIAMQRDMRKL